MGFLFIVHIWCSHYAFSHSLAGIFSDCGINHLANQKHKWREVISFFWTMGKNIWLLRQYLAVILFMWHYILYLEFHINCSGWFKPLNTQDFGHSCLFYTTFITNKKGKIESFLKRRNIMKTTSGRVFKIKVNLRKYILRNFCRCLTA